MNMRTALRRTSGILATLATAAVLSLSAVPAHALAADDDGDGMPNWWEIQYDLNPNKANGGADADRDGLSNLGEWTVRTFPRTQDSDRDGIDDGDEVAMNSATADPKVADTNANGVLDGDEDLDGNGVMNEDEDDALEACNANDEDTDGDFVADEDENDFGTSTTNPDTDGDGILDGEEDANGNGISDEDEDDSPNDVCTATTEDDDDVIIVM